MRRATLLATFMPALCFGDYSWHAVTGMNIMDVPGDYLNAEMACRAAVAMQFYNGEKRYVNHEMSENGYEARCNVQLKSCSTCAWETPSPPYWINGYTMKAVRWGQSCGAGKAYNKITGECFSNQHSNQGEPYATCATPSEKKGNPISIVNGNKFQKEVYWKGRDPLELSLAYNSLDGIWRHNYSTRLHTTQQAHIVVFPEGHSIEFDQASGIPISGGSPARLLRNGSEWLLKLEDGKRIYFNESGRMKKINAPNGAAIELTYDPLVYSLSPSSKQPYVSQTIRIKSGSQELSLKEYGQTLRLVEASIGGEIFRFGGSNYTLTKVNITNSIGTLLRSRLYLYESPHGSHLLTGITDERGIRFATWAYDSQDRAISSEHFDGADKIMINYRSDSSSVITNALGKQTTYRFAEFDGVKRITAVEGEPSANCPSSNSTFTYDTRGLLKTKTDNKGNLTTYDYNDRGLEISRTEAAGTPEARTVTTEWHPDFFLPLAVTESDRITRYQYDAQGRQLSRTVEAR